MTWIPKTLRATVLPALFGLSLWALPGCMNDGCDDLDCQNESACVNGTCVCRQWFEGENCENKVASRFAGSYNGVLNCNALDTLVLVIVEDETEVDRVNIINWQIYGNLSRLNMVEIPDQTWTDPITGLPVQIHGNITINEGQIALNVFSVDNDPPNFYYGCSFHGDLIQ